MLGRLLREAAATTADELLEQSAEAFRSIGDRRHEVAALFQASSRAPDPAAALPQVSTLMMDLADVEEAAWAHLAEAARA